MVLVIAIVLAATSLFSASAPASERVEIVCGSDGARVHPRHCLATGITPGAAEGVLLVGLHWSSWGGLTARGRGFVLNPEDGTRWAATVLLHGKMSCGGTTFYRSLRLKHEGQVVLHFHRLICTS
jgi:hypothetical protein